MQMNVGAVLLVVLIRNTVPLKTQANTGNALAEGREHTADTIKVMITEEGFTNKGSLQYQTEDQDNYGNLTGQRRKRSALSLLAQKGLAALKLLLKDTFQIPSKKYNVREFEKIGTLKTALKDFKDADPSFVTKIKYPNGGTGRYGYIGDRTIILKARGDYGRPNIEVIKRHRTIDEIDPLIDKIIYINDFKY